MISATNNHKFGSRKFANHRFGWMLLAGTALAASALISASFAADSSTRPANPNVTAITAQALQLQANTDIAKGDYASALPLLERVEQIQSDKPEQLGPLLEQIRVCRKQISLAAAGQPLTPTTGGIPLATAIPAAGPVSGVFDPENRKPLVRPAAGQFLDLQIKELGDFYYDADKGGNIPDDVKKVDGSHFRTTGYMIPLNQAENITDFVLVPSLFACCYGQPPQIQHTLIVHCPKGKAVSYFPDPIVVEGILHVDEQKDGGFIVSIFQIDASSVKPAAQ